MKVILCILDGFGIRDFDSANAIRLAKNWRIFLKKYPCIELNASGEFVGLPAGQMGNSEVGHMTIGCGQVFYHDLVRLNDMFKNNEITPKIPPGQEDCHILGLLSNGGVHSHEDHYIEAVKIASKTRQVFCHVFLDGRDTAPGSAIASLEKLLAIQNVKIATLSGRFYAMDRDHRWDRTKLAAKAILNADGQIFNDPITCIQGFYEKNITDEFILPCVYKDYKGAKENDSLWMINFRADRVRQILEELLKHKWSWSLGVSSYGIKIDSILKPHQVTQSLGEIISKAGLSQLRIAETEKYAHVTFFFNGGREEPFENEDRIMIQSPDVKTYDFAPKMSAQKITDQIVDSLKQKKYDVIIANYANPDMVGHTGVVCAIEEAILEIDSCIKILEEEALNHNYSLIITSDHGNAELMFNEDMKPHTAHTCSKVPFMIITQKKHTPYGNSLADIKKNILDLLNIKNY
jgi:2,3-bisphosphoglycerate-independent phosphoglycerate mutase